MTALMHASIHGHAATAKDLLTANALVNTQDSVQTAQQVFHTLNVIYQCGFLQQGLTALIWATLKGHAGIVQMLIDFGADPNMRTYDVGWEHQPTSRVRSSSHPLIVMLFNEVCFHDQCFGRKRTQRSCSQQPTDMWTLCVFF
jgi:ankyrin repeat protein